MGRAPEPINLVIAKGRKHLTKAEIEERKARELDVPFKEIKPPSYLSKKQRKIFKEIAGKLSAIDIYTELDADNLARYLMSQDLYLGYTKKLNDLVESDDIELLKDIQSLQDKAFRQAQQCARDLGLTISSRCKLVMPNIKEPEKKVNKFEKFKK